LGFLFAPFAGVLLYFSLIGLVKPIDLASVWSISDFLFISWIVAIFITIIIGLPLGWGAAHILRRLHMESLLAYLVIGTGMAVGLAFLVGDPAMGAGFVITAAILAMAYWFGVAKERVDKQIA
jgi:hypothetical protein